MSISEALEAARKEELDLVEISPAAVPPVCKIMDYGKYKYEQTRKAKDAKKKQKVVVVKEVKLRTRIDDHDLETKVNAIKKFLEKDNKVKVTLVQFGREKSYQDMGIELLDQVAGQLEDVAEVEKRYKESQKYLMLSAKNSFNRLRGGTHYAKNENSQRNSKESKSNRNRKICCKTFRNKPYFN